MNYVLMIGGMAVVTVLIKALFLFLVTGWFFHRG
jgi:hypothetical protein